MPFKLQHQETAAQAQDGIDGEVDPRGMLPEKEVEQPAQGQGHDPENILVRFI